MLYESIPFKHIIWETLSKHQQKLGKGGPESQCPKSDCGILQTPRKFPSLLILCIQSVNEASGSSKPTLGHWEHAGH
jgi:hypothetical protein